MNNLISKVSGFGLENLGVGSCFGIVFLVLNVSGFRSRVPRIPFRVPRSGSGFRISSLNIRVSDAAFLGFDFLELRVFRRQLLLQVLDCPVLARAVLARLLRGGRRLSFGFQFSFFGFRLSVFGLRVLVFECLLGHQGDCQPCNYQTHRCKLSV